MPEISEGLKFELQKFKSARATSMGGNELRDLKNYVQQTYRDNVDTGCSSCVGKWLDRLIRDNNI